MSDRRNMEVLAAGGGADDAVDASVAVGKDPEADAEADARFAAAVAATPPPLPPPLIPFTDAAAGFPEANFAAPPPMLLAAVAPMAPPRPIARLPALALDMGDGNDPFELEPEPEPEAEAESDRAGGIGMAWCVELMLRVIEVRSRTVGCDVAERHDIRK